MARETAIMLAIDYANRKGASVYLLSREGEYTMSAQCDDRYALDVVAICGPSGIVWSTPEFTGQW